MRLIRRLGANARYFTDQATKIPLDVCVRRRGRRDVHRLLRALPGRGRGRWRAARGASASSPRAARRRSTPIRSRCCAARRTATSRSRSSSSCCPTTGRSCGASGAARPAGRSATRCAGCPIVPHLYDPALRRASAPIPTRTPTRRCATSSTTAPGPARCYGAIAFVVRAMCVDPEPELQQAYARAGRGRLPARGDGAVRRRLGGRLRDGRGTAAGGAAIARSAGRGALVDAAGRRLPRRSTGA